MLDGIRANAQSWGVKLAFGIIILVFVFWGIGSYTGPKGYVATVNDMHITEIEFQKAYGSMEQNLRASYPDLTPELLKGLQLEQQVLQQLVMKKLLESEAGRIGLEISPYELRLAVQEMPYFLDKDGRFDKDEYLRVLKASGLTPAQFEAGLREDLLPEKLQSSRHKVQFPVPCKPGQPPENLSRRSIRISKEAPEFAPECRGKAVKGLP